MIAAKKYFFILLVSLISHFATAQHDTSLIISNSKVDIVYPNSASNAVILVLPGWGFSQDDICIKSDFCKKAKERGFILVLPDLKKSIYHSQIFPETRADRLSLHKIQWLTDTLIPYLQDSLNILNSTTKNFILGISTGGRGVALMAEHTGTLFVAGAALSGDFDQTLMPSDKLMETFYGSYTSFPERWKNIDNPLTNVQQIKIPFYIAHGENDKIVPVQQSKDFYEALKKQSSSLPHKLNIAPEAGHDYQFWSSQYDAVFEFFLNARNR